MANRDQPKDGERRDQTSSPGTDNQEAYERALQRKVEDLPGDMEQNRNLSGSTTYETLLEEAEERARGREKP